jgi:hypothetical protein
VNGVYLFRGGEGGMSTQMGEGEEEGRRKEGECKEQRVCRLLNDRATVGSKDKEES